MGEAREENSMRIAIMGAGSLGTVLGAYLVMGGKQIDRKRQIKHRLPSFDLF